MQRATTVFYDGDTQRDFLEPDGALYVPAAAPIIPNLARLTRLARAGTPRIRVIGTVCRPCPHLRRVGHGGGGWWLALRSRGRVGWAKAGGRAQGTPLIMWSCQVPSVTSRR